MRTPISSTLSAKLRGALSAAALAVVVGCTDTGAGGGATTAAGAADSAAAVDTGATPGAGTTGGDAADTGAWPGAVEPEEGGETDEGHDRGEAGCAALQLREASARDEDGDGAWRPGEALWVEATLVNDGDAAFYDAPGAELQAPVEDALVPEPVVAVYSLAAGEQALLRWWAVAAPAAGEARAVPLVLRVVSAEGGAVAPCPGGAHLALSVELSAG